MSLYARIRHKFLKKEQLDGNIYAVRHGTYKGNFIVYINSIGEDYNFLVLPFNDVLTITKKEFEDGIREKIVDIIERLPHNVYEICCAQYNESKTKSNIDRLKQSAAQSSMDRSKRKT